MTPEQLLATSATYREIHDSQFGGEVTAGIGTGVHHDELMAAEGFFYALYMSQFKSKAPGGGDTTATFISI